MSLRLRSVLIAGMSLVVLWLAAAAHELRTPLTVIDTHLQVLGPRQGGGLVAEILIPFQPRDTASR
ncbi:histidine kinase dimerization/phospho-acceptor domain-containing protein [Achromobacter aloeverae]